MSSIGVKLARKAEAPIIPLALDTRAWRNGNFLKDFGKIDVPKDVHFAFGEPIRVKGKGAEEHQMIIEFIETRLNRWKKT